MLSLPAQMRVFVAVEPVDMRKQFDGLWAVARERLGEDPKGGAIFAFTNKKRTRLKLLYFDGTGVWVFAKRVEQGRLTWPVGSSGKKLCIDPAALNMLINGIDLKKGTLKAWYER
jgi:transposase